MKMSFLTWRLFKTFCRSLISCPGALAACPGDAGLFITAPMTMEALSGSCLLIPCMFRPKPEQEFDGERDTFGVWIKSDARFVSTNNVILNSSGTVNSYPMSIIGNLSQKNCTTLFSSLIPKYTDTYFLRIENWPFRASAYCDPLQVSVKGKRVFFSPLFFPLHFDAD